MDPKTALLVTGLIGCVVVLAGLGLMVSQAAKIFRGAPPNTRRMNLKTNWPGFTLVLLGVVLVLVTAFGLK